MIKRLLLSIALLLTFFIFEPLMDFVGEYDHVIPLGLEMVLGMMTPLVAISFVSTAVYFMAASAFCAVNNKKLLELLPLAVLIIGILVYIFTADSDSPWVRVLNFYLYEY